MKTVRVACWIWLACALAACSSDKKLELGGTCTLNSDCTSPLLCKLGSCRKACVRSVDCENGGRCVTVDGVAVCQTQAESACGADQTCPTGLVCRTVDNTCRTPCSPTNDTSCVAGQTCSGTVCLENKEVTNPTSDAAVSTVDGAIAPDAASVAVADAAVSPDAGSIGPDLPVAPPDAASPDVPLATSDAASADVSLAKPDAAADAPADSGLAADTSGSAKPDTSPSNVCTPPCTVGQACVAGQCTACGRSAGQPCCDDTPCSANLTCNSANRCVCGGQDQACCSGTTCNTELKCLDSTCTCGEFGYACCAGSTCNNGGICAGVRCGCLTSCDDGFYQKTDGTFGGALSLKNQDGTPCTKAVSVANDPYNRGTACVVQTDGTVWCQGSNSNGLLGTGNSTMTSSSNLVPVLTGVAGSPLTGITKVVMGGFNYGGHACALAEAGGIWCWGKGDSGELGTGLSVGSSFAVPVLDSAGGSSFAEAMEIALGSNHTCAVRKGGTVWCWGYNLNGQLGTGSATPASVAIPTKVAVLADPVTVLSAYLATTCAIDSKRLVWCWGPSAGPDGSGNTNPSPIRLVVAKNGAAVTDAVQVDTYRQRVRKSDGSIWYWDYTATQPLTENGTAVSGAYWLGLNCWIGADGALRASNVPTPTCP